MRLREHASQKFAAAAFRAKNDSGSFLCSANLQGDDVADFNETEEIAIAEIPRAGLVKMEPRDDGIDRVRVSTFIQGLPSGGVQSILTSIYDIAHWPRLDWKWAEGVVQVL